MRCDNLCMFDTYNCKESWPYKSGHHGADVEPKLAIKEYMNSKRKFLHVYKIYKTILRVHNCSRKWLEYVQ